MASQPGKQTIAIQILLSISRSKGNQTDQLLEYRMRNTFLKNHEQNVAEKLVPNSFLTN